MRSKASITKYTPLILNSDSLYYSRAPITYFSSLLTQPNFTPINNFKYLISKWELIQLRDYEHLYRLSLTDDTTTLIETSFWRSSPTLISFFTTQLIDIPVCLAKIKYAHSSMASNPKQRLISILMRHGRRAYVSKAYSQAALNISAKYFTNQNFKNQSKTWELIYLGLSQRHVHFSQKTLMLPRLQNVAHRLEFTTTLNHIHTNKSRLTSDYDWFNEFLLDELTTYSPAFSLFAQQVNKLKRRHSRGKSGQYEVIWKYIPRYKRLLVVLRWLLKDVQLQKSKTFQQRLEKSLEILLLNKTDHMVYKFRRFVHKFVFNRFKKTLLKTLRTEY